MQAWSGRSTPSHRSIQGRTEPELEMHLNPSMGAPKPNRSTLLQRAQHITCSNQANKGPEGVVIDPHLTSGLPVMFRYSCIPQMPTATPVAANSGYTCTAERPPISKPRERERESGSHLRSNPAAGHQSPRLFAPGGDG
jgi:hypothetical protein